MPTGRGGRNAAGEVVALVPARGGSKGIPRKNLAPLGGRPLIAWTIEAGLAARTVDRVVVSTEDDEIARTAVDLGAEVPFRRPPELAEDDTADLPVFQHALAELARDGVEVELVVHLRPTSPLRPASFIDEGVELLRGVPEADSVRSVTPAAKSPYKMWRLNDGRLEPLLGGWADELFNQPRQALPEVWVHDGVLDVIRPAAIEAGSMCGQHVLALFTPAGVAVDIDTPDDLRRARELVGED